MSRQQNGLPVTDPKPADESIPRSGRRVIVKRSAAADLPLASSLPGRFFGLVGGSLPGKRRFTAPVMTAAIDRCSRPAHGRAAIKAGILPHPDRRPVGQRPVAGRRTPQRRVSR
mgnify:CR=1 FL=1